MKDLQKPTKEILKVIRKYDLNYEQLFYAVKKAREMAGLKKEKRKKEKRLPSRENLEKLFKTVEKASIKDKLMMKLLLYTGLRSKELVNLKVEDVEFSEDRIWISDGKGGYSDYVPIHREIKELLQIYVAYIPNNKYLFESNRHYKYTTRAIRWKFQKYCKEAGIPRIHPHLLRAYFITFLASKGWTAEQIQQLSRHRTARSLDHYVKLSLGQVKDKFQQDMEDLGL